jgi:hypothetical protein
MAAAFDARRTSVGQKTAREVSVDENVNGWLQRFGVLDAEEEEVIDQGPEYRALLGEQASNPERRADRKRAPLGELNPERRSNRYRQLLGEQAHDAAGAGASAPMEPHDRKLH